MPTDHTDTDVGLLRRQRPQLNNSPKGQRSQDEAHEELPRTEVRSQFGAEMSAIKTPYRIRDDRHDCKWKHFPQFARSLPTPGPPYERPQPFDARSPTSNIQRPGAISARSGVSALGCWALCVECWMFSLSYRLTGLPVSADASAASEMARLLTASV